LIESKQRCGEIENRTEVADFETISSRNRNFIAYFGIKAINLKFIAQIN